MSTLLQDLRYGLRILRKSLPFTIIAVVTLALGIGMASAIFGMVYAILILPLPYEHSEQIVQLHEINASGHRMQFADPNFEDIRSQAKSLQGVAEYAAVPTPVSGGTQPTRSIVVVASQDFFPVLRVSPVIGRSFSPEDHRLGAAPVALVSYGYWHEYLGGVKNLSSKILTIEDRLYSVVGVLPAGFNFPSGAEIFIPRELSPRYPSRTAHRWDVIARLRDGFSVTEVQAELQAIASRLKQQYGQDTMMTNISTLPLLETLTQGVRPALWILLGAVALLFLIACANVANLMLVRLAGRENEIAICIALGASRSRVIRQLTAEVLLLSGTGGVIGVFAAFLALKILLALSPGALPRSDDISLSVTVLLFSLVLCLFVATGFGIFAGFRSGLASLHAFVAGNRSQSGTLMSHGTNRVVVAGQLAIALTLLTGAALLGRSLLLVLSVNTGFHTENVIAMNLALPDAAGDTNKVRRIQFLENLFDRLHTIPGVEDVGGTSHLPLIGFHPDGYFVVMNPGEPLPSSEQALELMFHDRARTGDANYSVASDGYFRVLGIPLIRGRLFDSRDAANTQHVALISDSVARQKWPDEDPLGHEIEFGNMDGDLRRLTVVGVVGDVREEKLEQPASPAIYVDYRQRPQTTSDFSVVFRVNHDTGPIIAAARQAIRDLDPNIPSNFATLGQIVSGSAEGRRFSVVLVAVFAGTALVLAIAGMYGIMAYSVTRRTNEIGVRMALGASRVNILALLLGEGLVTAAIGAGIGIVASFAATRVISALLFGSTSREPLILVAAAVLLITVAMLASYFPAQNAAKLDPMGALRHN